MWSSCAIARTVRSATVPHHWTFGSPSRSSSAAACSSTAARTHRSPADDDDRGEHNDARLDDHDPTAVAAGPVGHACVRGRRALRGHPARQARSRPAAVLAPIAPILRRADIAVVNLETAITQRGTPQAKIYTFRAAANGTRRARRGRCRRGERGQQSRDRLRPRGADRHAGRAGAVEAGRRHRHRSQRRPTLTHPFRATVHGQRIAIIGASQVIDTHFIATWSATDAQPGIASAKTSIVCWRRYAPCEPRATRSLCFCIGVRGHALPDRRPTHHRRAVGASRRRRHRRKSFASARRRRSSRLRTRRLRPRQLRVLHGHHQRRADSHDDRSSRRPLRLGTRLDHRRRPQPRYRPGEQTRDRRLARPAARAPTSPRKDQPAWRGETASSSSGMRHHR